MKLKSKGERVVQGKQTFTIDLKDNGLDKDEVVKLLKGKVAQIDGKFHVVHDIVSMVPHSPNIVGLMVTHQAAKYVRENTLP